MESDDDGVREHRLGLDAGGAVLQHPTRTWLLLLCAVALCFSCNRDIFSPGKFYHGALTVYFADVFLSEQSGYVYGVYLGFILAGMFLSVAEAYTFAKHRRAFLGGTPSRMVPARFVVVLWGLSFVPVLAQGYLIHRTGGLSSLAMTIAHRVVERRGLGPLVMFIKLIAPINLIYFTVGLAYRKRRPNLWWLLYGLHSVVFVVTGLLLGGRGFVLGQALFMMVIYNYLRKPVKFRYALVAGVVLLTIAAFLGTVRNNLTRLESLDGLGDMQGETLNLKMFSYGTNPLNVVLSREFTDYQYGKTFLTPVTNLIPRKIWPEKFESGGVVLTRFWKGRSYTGLTHMSTGLVTEGILNFGYPLGTVAGFVILFLVMLMTLRWYARLRWHLNRQGGVRLAFLVCIYAYIVQIAGGLLCGEFQNYIGGFLIRLFLLSGLVLILRLRMPPFQVSAASSPMPNC